MDAGDQPSTILIDGVPVEGVEEFICLGSKQSSNGFSRRDVLRRIGLACSVMNSLQWVWKCSSLSIDTKVHLRIRSDITSACTGNVRPALWYRNADLLGRRHEYTGGFNVMCQRQILDIR